jgi:Spy/CpxP family protein refolding chaperone
MKRSLLSSGLAAVAFAAMTLSAFADDRPAAVLAGRDARGHGLQRLRMCLALVDLNADEKAAIQAIVAAAQPGLQADADAVRADHQKLRADVSGGADKCVVGQDLLTAHADADKLRADAGAVRDQILAKLTPDQQNRVKGCLQAGHGMRGSRAAGFASGDHQD